ncbi:helix-turn-helix transcriptional regulator [Metaclostridioides mangenotii]|uniref:helix-turn-helix domain-containing protein n=1 Tax=Metaclostridioides mangenotii TaxID=1540 RepID=UPI0028EC2F1C|nr:helix-turn-helix transcriptional regulator [Clostridioides mangenotii]
MNIGDNIKRTRELKGISQIELSKISKIPRISLGRYERNERDVNIEILNKIAIALKVDITILLAWTDNIITNNDVFIFFNNFYPSKFYESNNAIELLQNLMDITYSNAFSVRYGIIPNAEVSIKFVKLFNLSNKQIYNCILSSKISNYIFENYNFDMSREPELHNVLVNNIIELNILNFQSIDDLLENNLNLDNNLIIDEYMTYQLTLGFSKIESKYDNTNKNNTFGIDEISKSTIDEINQLMDQFDKENNQVRFSESIDKIKNLALILKYYNFKFSISEDMNTVKVSIDKDDFYEEFDLDDFMNFIDKISWNIEYEIENLKNLYS